MHEKFMTEALKEAELALREGEFPVGCVIVEDKNVITQGRRVNSFMGNELDHAEIVALRSLHTKFPDAAKKDLTVYATMEPCLMCFAALLLNNIKTIVYAYEDVMGGGTTLSLNHLKPLYRSMEVEIIPGIMREESLKLFKRFFSNDKSGYWQDSYLAEFTLNQKIES